MPVSVKVLHLTVIGPFVRDVKCSGNWAAVRVDVSRFKQVAVKLLVQVVDGIIESQQDQLGHILSVEASCCVCVAKMTSALMLQVYTTAGMQ